MTDLLTLDEVARYLRVSRRTIERLVMRGRIRAIRPSPGRIVVTEKEVQAYSCIVTSRSASRAGHRHPGVAGQRGVLTPSHVAGT